MLEMSRKVTISLLLFSVCFFVSTRVITQKVVYKFSWNFKGSPYDKQAYAAYVYCLPEFVMYTCVCVRAPVCALVTCVNWSICTRFHAEKFSVLTLGSLGGGFSLFEYFNLCDVISSQWYTSGTLLGCEVTLLSSKHLTLMACMFSYIGCA